MPNKRAFRQRARITVYACTVLAFALAGAAEASEAQRCQANKLRAAGAEARAGLACEAKALATGDTAACRGAAEERRDDAFTRLEAGGVCTTTGDSDDIGEEVAALVAAALAELRPGGPAASECTAAQLALLGRAMRKLTAAHAHDQRYPDPGGLLSRLAVLEARFDRAFARSVAHGDCLSSADSAGAWAIVAAAAARLRGLLAPTCGDGIRAQTEACDGSDTGACPGACRSDCSCETCPCWTTESLEATFPPGFFDQNGRGGATCPSGAVIGVGSVATCFIPEPRGPGFHLPRSAAVVIQSNTCLFYAELDPGGAGSCGVPSIVSVTPAQAALCVDELLASKLVEECP